MKDFIRFGLLSVLVGSLFIASGCALTQEVVVDENAVVPVTEDATVEVEAEVAVEPAVETPAQ